MTLTPGQVARIVRLADDGVPLRSICRATGVGRDTVRRVVQKRWRLRQRQVDAATSENSHVAPNDPASIAPVEGGEAIAASEPPDELAEQGLYNVKEPVFTQPPARCPTCGGYGYMPCLACRLARRRRKQRGERRSAS